MIFSSKVGQAMIFITWKMWNAATLSHDPFAFSLGINYMFELYVQKLCVPHFPYIIDGAMSLIGALVPQLAVATRFPSHNVPSRYVLLPDFPWCST